MSTIGQVPPTYRFPSGLSRPIAVLTVSLDDIAARFGMELVSWFEDGLGPARGVAIRLASGRIVVIKEFEHAIKHFGRPGPELFVDGADIVSLGVSALVDEVVSALGLSQSAVAWKASEDIRQSPELKAVADWRARNDSNVRPPDS
jgi:hypothetical protein